MEATIPMAKGQSKKALESKIETYFKEQIEHVGGKAMKFKSTINGVPDQIVLFKGVTYFVELKRPDETPRATQLSRHREFKQHGIDVHIVDDVSSTDKFIEDVLKVNIKEKIKPKNTTHAKIKKMMIREE